VITRTASAIGLETDRVAASLADQLAAGGTAGLSIAFVFADWRLDPARLAQQLAPRLAPGRLVGGTTIGVIGGPPNPANTTTAVALGLYGSRVRAGIGLAAEIRNQTLVRARDAATAAARALGAEPAALDPARHVGITFVDGTCACEEAFCVGTAVLTPQLQVVGSCAATEIGSERRAFVFADDRALSDAGTVIILDTTLPFHALRSAHLVATDARTVVTASAGRTIEELDGKPAVQRLREILGAFDDGALRDAEIRSRYAFARYVDNVPYVRSIVGVEGRHVMLASGVEPGHVLRVMRPGDLIGTTRTDLARAAERVGGSIDALLAFSCIGRHWEAAATGVESALDDAYRAHGAIGCQSYGEQTGMLLVNHTLTGLALGGAPA
jgi:hypothetical protein